ncbi:MAG: threonine/serine exporter family protein [Gammaproteobacteria bacterium]|jgi:uncharacterized membrane protein YjjP (DUF1212 family)|nr:threonine/serine exporter family protein [Gammaproteobacteria bacterium]
MFNKPCGEIDHTEVPQLEGEGLARQAQLILTMGRALLTLGSPAHRLETAMTGIAERLGLTAQFFSTPSALFVALGKHHRQQTFMMRITQSGVDFSRLADITAIIENVADSQDDLQAAVEQVEHILVRPPQYGQWLMLASYVLVGMPVAFLLGGGWVEAGIGGAAALMVASLAWLGKRYDGISRLFVPVSAAAASFVTFSWCAWHGNTALLPATMAALVTLLPGLDLTIATRELSTGHLVSGSSRLASVLLVFATLGFGLALGGALAKPLFGIPPVVDAIASPLWLLGLAAITSAVGFTLLFNAHLRDAPWILLVVAVSWVSGTVGNMLLGVPLGAFAGGVMVGLTGNLYARIMNRPGSILHTPGLLLLVPGSVGFRSLHNLLNADIITGIQTAFLAVLTAVALTVGMIVASTLIKPRNEL